MNNNWVIFNILNRKGSVVPEVQLLASQDLNAAEKSNWLSVVYNEISSGGKLGNFTVSDISALSADGKIYIVERVSYVT